LFYALGFLAVCFAAVALRHTELKLAGVSPDSAHHPASEMLSGTADTALQQHVSEGSFW